MLDPADEDLIALVDAPPSPRLGYQVDSFGRAADKYNLFRRPGIQKVRHLAARILIGIGGAGCELMGGTMNVGVLVFVKIRNAVDHALRLLRGGCVVQPDQRMAVHLFVQYRKVAAHRADVELLPGKLKVADSSRVRCADLSNIGTFRGGP